MLRFVIVGAGGIGRLFGAQLCRGGHEVTFVDTDREVVDAINAQGVGVVPLGAEHMEDVVWAPASAVTDPAALSSCDCVILAVKSFDTLAAIGGVAHLVGGETPALTLQTGLDNLEVMEKVVPRVNILGGFTFMAATALGPGVVRHGGSGKTYLGELDGRITPRLERIADAFNACGLVTEKVRRIVGRLWCKVIVYAAINPVSAILRVKNGRLLEAMESVTLMKRLIDEGRAVAEAHSVDLVYHDLYDLLFDACRRTHNNLSTMLQDVLNQKRTEIGSLNGALCRYGEEKGVRLPTHHTIIQIVKLLEKWGYDPEHNEE